MDVYEAIYGRYSVRSFDKSKTVQPDLIEKLVKAAIQAPNSGNTQSWRFYVVSNEKLKNELSRAAFGQYFIAEAPVVIVVCADLYEHDIGYGRRGVDLYSIQDSAAAIENILLAAYSEGLGSCWVGAFSEKEAHKVMNLDKYIRPLALVPIGYPKSTKPTRKFRKPFEEVVKIIR